MTTDRHTDERVASTNRSRREFLKTASLGVLAGGFAGCLGGVGTTGDEGGTETTGESSSSTTARWAGTQNPDTTGWDFDAELPEGPDGVGLVYPIFELERRLDERESAPDLTLVGSQELCSEQSCMSKLDSRVIQLGSSSVANSAKIWPENEIWSIPYTFPVHQRASIGYSFVHPTTWEEYWVPFAKKYNVVPIGFDPPGYRAHLTGIGSDPGEPVTSPADFEGRKIRTTQSEVISTAFDELGMNPITISFADTLQGMKSGVVDGLEIIPPYAVAAQITSITAQVTLTQWAPGLDPIWCHVDFLKGLSDAERTAFAEVTADLAEQSIQRTDRTYERFQGLSPDAPVEGSNFYTEGPDGEPVRVNWLSEDQLDEWKNPVNPADNRDLYSDTIDRVHDEFTDGFFDRLYDLARESGVPDDSENFTLDAWWDDYLDRI
ncbi:TRAP transporter substrate-binding protein [Salinirarus marinus]|uniref:TRAP transporter substrate-binding protein n=1 Tax=Salinirarus marinus TaxID=3068310 RepID=UPI003C6C0311